MNVMVLACDLLKVVIFFFQKPLKPLKRFLLVNPPGINVNGLTHFFSSWQKRLEPETQKRF